MTSSVAIAGFMLASVVATIAFVCGNVAAATASIAGGWVFGIAFDVLNELLPEASEG